MQFSKSFSLLLGTSLFLASAVYAQTTCSADGMLYGIEGEYADGYRIIHALQQPGNSEYLILAGCHSSSQLRMLINKVRDNEFVVVRDIQSMRNDIVEKIASAETYTYEDVVRGLSHNVASYEVTELSTNHCICTTEVN